jgi:hypothetical protein
MPHTSTHLPFRVFAAILVLLPAASAIAQIPPCGRKAVRAGGQVTVLRFVPSPIEHVRASAIRALPTLSAFVSKEKNGIIEAKLDKTLSQNTTSANRLGTGEFSIEITPARYGGVNGSLLSIDFSKGMTGALASTDKLATPLANEIGCLVGLLSPTDSSTNPGGQASTKTTAALREISVPEKTKLKIAVREPLYSKELAAKPSARPALEVIEDVVVDVVTVFRKGAIAKGRLSGVKAAQSGHRGGTIELTLESATTVDGQEIAVEGGYLKEEGQILDAIVQQQYVTGAVVGGSVGVFIAAMAK